METSELKTRIRNEVLARRNAIDPNERAQRSMQVCEQLLKRYEFSLVPGIMIAGYAALGSEIDPRTFLCAALNFECKLCLPCMVHGDIDESILQHDHHVGDHAHTHDHQHENDCQDESIDDTHMVFYEINQKDLDENKLPFLRRPSRTIAFDDPTLLPLKRVRPNAIDIVIAPLVAFDAHNNRLGYGGGNYDRFISQLNLYTTVTGIAFSEQEVPRIPTEEHDCALPHIEIA